MKISNKKGITLTMVILYVFLSLIVLTVLGSIISHFRKNTKNLAVLEIEFDKFNIQILKETENENNMLKTRLFSQDKITFYDGENYNTYTYNSTDKAIYLNNNIKICENIDACRFIVEKVNGIVTLTVTMEVGDKQRTSTYSTVSSIRKTYPDFDGLGAQEVARLNALVTERHLTDVTNENLKDPDVVQSVVLDTSYGTGNELEIPIPVGAQYFAGNAKSGLVISFRGNEFVWVPVADAVYDSSKDSKLPKTSSTGSLTSGHNYTPMAINIGTETNPVYKGLLYYNYNTTRGSYLLYPNNTNYIGTDTQKREPAYLTDSSIGDASSYNTVGLTKESLQNEYNAMIESVKMYGGFYVSRFECSLEGTTLSSMNNKYPMSAETTSGGMWYGMYQKCKNYKGLDEWDSVQSQMIWGSQYDAMLNWILTGNSKSSLTMTTNGNHNGSIFYTGAKASDVINNIYDLEGNMWEWTAEADGNNYRVGRGR